MEDFRKTLLGLDWIVKVILVFVYNVYGFLYRLTKGVIENDTKLIVVAILMLIPPISLVMLIIDVVAVLANKGEPTFLA